MVLTKQQSEDIENLLKGILRKEDVIQSIATSITEKLNEKLKAAFQKYDEKIAVLEIEIGNLKSKNEPNQEQLEQKIDKVQQENKNNNLRIMGIKEEVHEAIEEKVIDLIRNKLKINMGQDQMAAVYRVGQSAENKTRHTVVAFTNNKIKLEVYKKKRLLKGTGVVIKEDLTACRLKMVQIASENYGYKNVWTINGCIYAKTESGIKKDFLTLK